MHQQSFVSFLQFWRNFTLTCKVVSVFQGPYFVQWPPKQFNPLWPGYTEEEVGYEKGFDLNSMILFHLFPDTAAFELCPYWQLWNGHSACEARRSVEPGQTPVHVCCGTENIKGAEKNTFKLPLLGRLVQFK